MLKKIYIPLIIMLIGLIGGAFFYQASKVEKVQEVSKYYPVDEKGEYIKQEKLTQEQKIEQFKRRINFRSILRKGDFYSIQNMKETALQYYLNAYVKLPHDHVIERKIGDTYFEMKNFQEAYNYYNKVPNGDTDDKFKEKMLKSLLYTANSNMRDEFNKLDADTETKDYYDKVLVCYTGIKNCIEEFKSYSGSTAKVLDIQRRLIDFEKIDKADPNTRYAMLAGIFFENKDYLAASIIGEEALDKRPNYTSILKTVGYSHYELGNYKTANDFLQRYYEIDSKDYTVTYVLGILNFYLENYVSSNLYFNAAVINGYRPKNELQKRLAYNYYILGDNKNMIKVFRYILAEEEATTDDFSVAIYTAIEEMDYSKAMLWANKGIKKFPDDDMLYAFRGWLYRLRKEDTKALPDLKRSAFINPRNAVALYNLGVLAFEKNEYTDAKAYLEGTIEADKDGTFGDKAEQMMTELNKIEAKKEELFGSGDTSSIATGSTLGEVTESGGINTNE